MKRTTTNRHINVNVQEYIPAKVDAKECSFQQQHATGNKYIRFQIFFDLLVPVLRSLTCTLSVSAPFSAVSTLLFLLSLSSLL